MKQFHLERGYIVMPPMPDMFLDGTELEDERLQYPVADETPDVRRTMKFTERLKQLGFENYEAYLASPHWAAFKDRYAQSDRPQRCLVCQTPTIELHHQCYERIGSERLDDVVPLCFLHHEQVHKMLADAGKFVDSTAWAVGVLAKKSVIVIDHPDQRWPMFSPSGKKRIADIPAWRGKRRHRR